jgi:hypothetical protein
MTEQLESTKVLLYRESLASIAVDDIALLALLLASCCCMHVQQQLWRLMLLRACARVARARAI